MIQAHSLVAAHRRMRDTLSLVLNEQHASGHAAGKVIGDRACLRGNVLYRQFRPPQHHAVADLRVWRGAQVQRNQIHRDATDQWNSLTADQYRRTGQGAARITVAVADGGNADSHVLWTGPGAVVTDTLAALDLVDCDQARTQGHRRAKTKIRTAFAIDHREAI